MSINFFWFHAVPTPAAKEYESAGGAYIHCWIRDGDREEAERRAIELIAAEGWEVQALQEASKVTSADYVNDEENREFYEEALVEAEVLVFYTWPGGEDDDDWDGEDDGDEGDGDEDGDEETK